MTNLLTILSQLDDGSRLQLTLGSVLFLIALTAVACMGRR